MKGQLKTIFNTTTLEILHSLHLTLNKYLQVAIATHVVSRREKISLNTITKEVQLSVIFNNYIYLQTTFQMTLTQAYLINKRMLLSF